jgi:Spy/CpxP family protein refolding chaperone
MKTFFSRYKLLIWVVVFLMVLNISAIGTILFHKYRQYKIVTRPPAGMRYHAPGPGIYLKEELNLTNEQYARFNEARMNYQKTASDINLQLNKKKGEYLTELMTNSPDRLVLQASCDSIGSMHARLMSQTGKYYDEIRKLCNDEQVNKLNTFFMKAMQFENNAMMRGKGMRQGSRSGGRNFRNNKY